MRELTATNAQAYLTEKGFINPGPARIDLLGGGVSNIVLRVETPERTFVLKQSCPQLRTRDAWFSDLERVFREQDVMQVLEPLLPPMTVPCVLFSDRENFVFAMSHAPADARVWKNVLLNGETDHAIAEHVGEILGIIGLGQVAVIRRAPDLLVDAVEDADEIPSAFSQQAIEPATGIGGQYLFCVGRADGRERVAIDDAGLEK